MPINLVRTSQHQLWVCGTELAEMILEDSMSLVRLLGFITLSCGCVVGRYRELATNREVSYVEEKGKTCGSQGHRRNHTVTTGFTAGAAAAFTKAS